MTSRAESRSGAAQGLLPRWASRVVLALVLLWVGACAGTGQPSADAAEPPVRVGLIECVASLGLRADGSGLAREIEVELVLAPKDPVELRVLGRRPKGQKGDDAVVEVEVAWTDYLGVQPTSYGGSFRRVLPFGADGVASREDPLRRALPFQLSAPDGRVLARRVNVWARLHPVDLQAGDVRSGGASQEFTRQSLLTLAREPAGDWESLLAAQEREPGDLFLACLVAEGRGEHPIGRFVEALPSAEATDREELFGALQCLTGQTHGRSVYRWQSWWSERSSGALPP